MEKISSTSRSLNHNDDASSSSSRKRLKAFDNGGVLPWSDVDHDVLFLVMMQLGLIDFFAFSGVCKSWRSFALSHRSWFMTSKPPMSICIDPSRAYNQDLYCYLNDFQGRRFKTILPHSACRTCIGVTCGYLILFGRETRDFWLVNPITRHEFHFPNHPSYVGASKEISRGILVFSPSISGWVFLLLHRKITFSIAGKRGWTHVSSTVPIVDLHFFMGKIYTLHTDCTISELRLYANQKRKWTLLETEVLPNPDSFGPRLLSLNEDLFMINRYPEPLKKVLELDFGEIKWLSPGMVLDFAELKWVSPGKKLEEHSFFVSLLNYSAAAVKPESWAGCRTNHKSYDCFLDDEKSRKFVDYKVLICIIFSSLRNNFITKKQLMIAMRCCAIPFKYYKHDREDSEELMQKVMNIDFSWDTSASQYEICMRQEQKQLAMVNTHPLEKFVCPLW